VPRRPEETSSIRAGVAHFQMAKAIKQKFALRDDMHFLACR